MAGIDLNDTGGKVEEDLNDLPCYTYCKSLSLPFRIGLWKLVRVRPLLPPSPSMSLCISADLFRKSVLCWFSCRIGCKSFNFGSDQCS